MRLILVFTIIAVSCLLRLSQRWINFWNIELAVALTDAAAELFPG